MVMGEIEQDVSRLLAGLESSNVVERKRSLEKISMLLNKISEEQRNEEEEREANPFMNLWDEKISRFIYSCLDDPGERCREIASEIVLTVINHSKVLNNTHLSHVFPVLRHRLANCSGERSLESSEEVRLCFLKIMIAILNKDLATNADAEANTNTDAKDHSKLLFPYMDDVISVLKTTLTDSYAEIKTLSCDGVQIASKVFKKDFHMMGNTLINPIFQCLSYQQKKVRVRAIQAIGVVMLFSTSDDFKPVAHHLAQRLFDHIPQVRLQVSLTTGKLLLEWRYSAT